MPRPVNQAATSRCGKSSRRLPGNALPHAHFHIAPHHDAVEDRPVRPPLAALGHTVGGRVHRVHRRHAGRSRGQGDAHEPVQHGLVLVGRPPRPERQRAAIPDHPRRAPSSAGTSTRPAVTRPTAPACRSGTATPSLAALAPARLTMPGKALPSFRPGTGQRGQQGASRITSPLHERQPSCPYAPEPARCWPAR